MSALPKRSHAYITPVCDSTRWDHFKPRSGDIVVCTAPKCGTTWTQMICAMFVHGSPDLPKPLTQLSGWLGGYTLPIEDQCLQLSFIHCQPPLGNCSGRCRLWRECKSTREHEVMEVADVPCLLERR